MPKKLTRRPRLTPANRKQAQARVRGMLRVVTDDIANLHQTTLTAILPVLQRAEKEVAASLAEWLAKAVRGDERFTAHRYRQVLAQLRRSRMAILKRARRNPEWMKELEAAMLKGLDDGAQVAGALATKHIMEELTTFDAYFGSTMPPIQIRPAAILEANRKTLVPRFRTSAARYAGGVWDDIKGQLAVGVVRNETIDELTRRLNRLGGPRGLVSLRGVLGEPGARAEYISEGLFARHRYWAERLARTETINAYNVVADDSIREAQKIEPKIKRRWDASLDSRLCIICRGLHGEVRDVGEEFSDGSMYPPAHPNCFPGWTMVVTSSGEKEIRNVRPGDRVLDHKGGWSTVKRVFHRWFDGELVSVKSATNVVDATPNHPFATPSGWVEAEQLSVESDKVFVLKGLPPVPEEPPSTSKKRGFLGGVISALFGAVMPVPSVKFDGNSLGNNGEINIELTNGFVWDRMKSEFSHRVENPVLVGGMGSTLDGNGTPDEFVVADNTTSAGRICRRCLGLDLRVRHSGVSPRVILRDGSHHTSGMENVVDWSPATPITGRKGHSGFARQVQIDHGLLVDVLEYAWSFLATARTTFHSLFSKDPVNRVAATPVLSGNFITAFPGEVSVDDLGGIKVSEFGHCFNTMRITDSSRKQFHGFVYNLEVADSETYVANGIVVHNCRCATTAWHEDWDEGTIGSDADRRSDDEIRVEKEALAKRRQQKELLRQREASQRAAEKNERRRLEQPPA